MVVIFAQSLNHTADTHHHVSSRAITAPTIVQPSDYGRIEEVRIKKNQSLLIWKSANGACRIPPLILSALKIIMQRQDDGKWQHDLYEQPDPQVSNKGFEVYRIPFPLSRG
ncbi:unnamed protein product [Lactuca virosa]|uniref:Uncharacterized protein n=1 Tax=Lactuca virosa TaxID=75947 RepID=A0AAU9MWN1_9ASTR|nr:unnamed protein product [Lactuca virosa]